MANQPICVFLSGPIGAGKSTLGRSVAQAMGGHFVEGDEHSPRDRPWYAASLSTNRSIFNAVIRNATELRPVVVAYPLGCINWIFYRRRLAEAGIRLIVVSLSASFEAITKAERGRSFSEAERLRIREMIEEGYGQRPFSDLIVQAEGARPEIAVREILAGLSGKLQ